MAFKSAIGSAVLSWLALTSLAQADPSGLWREKDGGTIIVAHCGSDYCGTIASVNPPVDSATGKPLTDKNNADAKLRSRPAVGITVLRDMKSDGPSRWSGDLYDIDRGRTFTGHLVEVDARTIRIEGCMLRVICGGENLKRVSQ